MNSFPFSGPPQRLTDHSFLNLFTTEVHTADGRRPWIFASRKQMPLSGNIKADAVVLIVIVRDADEARLVVIREFRAPLGRFQVALPAGLIDNDEVVSAAAARELFEETGLTLSNVVHVSPPIAPSAGLTDETLCLVYGEATGTISRVHQDKHEDIETRFLNLAELRSLIETPSDDVVCLKLYLAIISFLGAGRIALPHSTS